MYLKSVEMIGFKSFAERTKLNFEPGMTSIVGPNGCGKSNVSDAIRWVIGEQSAKAMRAGSMTDVIFAGTDTAKPLNMAEVSLTLTDCESTLGTEYNEITISRRVFRSGEGHYYLNKRPCRLKDIKRLFMDTGMGSNSYSIMAQGNIAYLLNARPEDRRSVFEEASGITKYLSDKKEAMRKLDQTEDNLLRLDDIIREVKRQIGSLQRQAGKARRYKEFQEKLTAFDLYVSRVRIKEFSSHIAELDKSVGENTEKFDLIQAEVRRTEELSVMAQEVLKATDSQIDETINALNNARLKSEDARHTITVNKERIKFIESSKTQDTVAAEQNAKLLEELKTQLEQETQKLEQSTQQETAAKEAFHAINNQSREMEASIQALRNELNEIRSLTGQTDDKLIQLKNQLDTEERKDKDIIIRRERLVAEQSEHEQLSQNLALKVNEFNAELQDLEQAVNQRQEALDQLKNQSTEKSQLLSELRNTNKSLEKNVSANEAKLELLKEAEQKAEEFPGGARVLLNDLQEAGFDSSNILGALARKFEAEPSYQKALESCLRSWVDAVIVSDSNELKRVLNILEERQQGSARIVSAKVESFELSGTNFPGTRLIGKVHVPDELQDLAHRLLGNVLVVADNNEIPEQIDPMVTYVTMSGTIMRGDGSAEFCMDDDQLTNPMARQHQKQTVETELHSLKEQLAQNRNQLEELSNDQNSMQELRAHAQAALDLARQNYASRKGEYNGVERQSKQASDRFETVSFELNAILEKTSSGTDKKAEMAQQIEDSKKALNELREKQNRKQDEQSQLEQKRSELNVSLDEKRSIMGDRINHSNHVRMQLNSLNSRASEMELLIKGKEEDINEYHNKIEELKTQITQSEEQIAPLKSAEESANNKLQELRDARAKKLEEVDQANKELNEKREIMEQLRTVKSKADIQLAEEHVRLSNLTERIAANYNMSLEEVEEHPDPEWEDGEIPALEDIEVTVAELRTKMDSMGPVNLVAIEEFAEHEERYQFLLQQQADLNQSKDNLMEMIKKINETTTELFTTTFDQVNENFQGLFKKLFGKGASAKLVLVNEEEVLESGIEIIARPPGKKTQSISLLSGGEQTMTAVALLFALYMVKPSPFCVLDELDAPLDDSNIGRFLDVVRGFLTHAQFIVITHNQRTIAAADTLYGVTMQRKGISELVSVKLSEYDAAKENMTLEASKNSKGNDEPAEVN